MTQPQQSKTRRLRRAVMMAVLGGLAMVAVADTVTVKKSAIVLAGKSPFASPVETVDSTMPLEVLGREGAWLHVRTPSGKEGYISKSKLPADKNAGGLTGSGQASGAEAATAGRGLTQDAEQYAASKSLSPKDTQQVVDWGNLLTEEDLQKFAAEGHVGPNKYRK